MRQAIGMVFDKTQHRNYRWNILRPWEYELDQLYDQHKNKNLKERLESLINYPLGPTQFEIEWIRLVDECGIAENPAIKALWDKRERWIAAYFKGMYCGRMTSTQRLESQNRMLKDTPSFPVYKAYTYIKIQTFSSLTNNLTIKFLFL